MPKPPFEDPFVWFETWYDEALAAVSVDPNAMTLATVSAHGSPSSRVVLLKAWDRDGFVFYTNRESRKGIEIAQTGRVALSFYWRDLGRQIRIEGRADRVDDETSDAYFASRPRGAQVGAWASLQSSAVASSAIIEQRLEEFEAQFEGVEVPRPPHWGGYRVVPNLLEFWSSGDNRIHERWLFERSGDGWDVTMLFP